MEEKLKSVDPVKIDDGTFKYILIKVYDPDDEDTSKFIVRGTGSAEYHGNTWKEKCFKSVFIHTKQFAF